MPITLPSAKPILRVRLQRGQRSPSRSQRIALGCRSESKSNEGHKAEANAGRESKLSLEDPSQAVVWAGRLPSKRRAITGGLSGLAILLVSNLGGATGALLGLDGGRLASAFHLDVLYPVRGFKRCLDAQNGFEFQYPSNWLADQRMFRRNAERQEQLRGLDPPPTGLRRRGFAEPVAAFGPPGSTGELNISVIVAPIQRGFVLSSLGGPEMAGQRFLSNTIAPQGSGLTTNLISATQRTDEAGQLYYSLEYTVERPGKFYRHNASTYASRNGFLYTLNGQCPESSWKENEKLLRQAAISFRVNKSGQLPPGLSSPPLYMGGPQRLAWFLGEYYRGRNTFYFQ